MADEWEFQIGDILQFCRKDSVDDGLRIICDIDYENEYYQYENLYNGKMQTIEKDFVEGIDELGDPHYVKVG